MNRSQRQSARLGPLMTSVSGKLSLRGYAPILIED